MDEKRENEPADHHHHHALASPTKGAGIVVPKRSSIISGLNQQFKQRTKGTSAAHSTQHQHNSPQAQQNLTSLGQPSNVQSAELGGVSGELQAAQVITKSPPAVSALFPLSWLASRHQSAARRKQQQQQPQQDPSSTPSVLYLDRYQQQLLAANPSLLNPADGQMSNLSLALLTRNSGELNGQMEQFLNSSANLSIGLSGSPGALRGVSTEASSSNSQQQQQQQQQLYRGYSLIELEVKCDADRRYVRNLYANLTAAINEQATRAGSGHSDVKQSQQSTTVSPYVDVDFWSFRYALNDRVDIMVSPKSRAFILGQLNRAKIRHRIKIDDIQARLDQQQQLQFSSFSTSGSSHAGLSNESAHFPLGKSADSPLNGRQISASEQQQLGKEQQQSEVNNKMPFINGTYFFDNYQRLAEINQYLEYIVEQSGDVAKVKVIGRSSQNRYLRVLVLGYEQRDLESAATLAAHVAAGTSGESTNVGDPPTRQSGNASFILRAFFARQEAVKKVGSIWLDGGTHAREWISPATTLYLAFRLSDNHHRCSRFYESLRSQVANQAASEAAAELAAKAAQAAENEAELRAARRYNGEPQVIVSAQGLLVPNQPLDPELIPSINEINSSLLSSASNQPLRQPERPRTEFEKSMELLAKNPQVLASEFGCDLEIDQLLRRYTFYIMPVLNPDGYEYTHTHNRLWRKTRSVSSHPIYRHFCLGVDANRNYDSRHGSTGSSSHPCSQTYSGSVPFTEPETRHQSNFVYANRMNMKMFITFHSYSQMILIPYSHSRTVAPDYKDLESVGQAAVKAIERTHGTQYKVGPSSSILYSASGTASDWAYEKAGVKYSYTIELRDTGAYGFLLPRQQIVPTGEETFNGLLAMIDQMEKNDNLLTSKSSHLHSSLPKGAELELAGAQPANLTMGDPAQQPGEPPLVVDYNHVPSLDQLRSQADQRRQRPPLENILDGSNTWAAAPLPPSGVRDRKPSGAPPPDDPLPASAKSDADSSATLSITGFDAANSVSAAHLLDDYSNLADDEPDAGYAFEGEGELMEPTRENIIEAAKLNAARLTGRRSHSRRIGQAAALTSSGRNSINSPLLITRLTTSTPKRESSEILHETP